MTLYIDDLYAIISQNISAIEAFSFTTDIIIKFKNFDLLIKIKKTMLLTNNDEIANKFKVKFPIVNEDLYLGRKICITGDGCL